MKFLRTLLVVITEPHDQDAAVIRALKFASRGNMSIHLLSAVYEPLTELDELLSEDQIKKLRTVPIKEVQTKLNQLSLEIQAKGIRCDQTVLWHRRLPEAIDYAVKHLSPDLVIKQVGAELDNPNPLAMPAERYLLRNCQAPLLLVRKAVWSKGPILAAIDPTTRESMHASLNQSVLNCASMLSELVHCPYQVVSVFVDTSRCSAIPELAPIQQTLREKIKQWQQRKLKAVMADHPLASSSVHLLEGSPEKQIPSLANKLQAQMLVIGTIGKCAATAGDIGNTAERVLSQIQCDVLALQPDQLAHADALLSA